MQATTTKILSTIKTWVLEKIADISSLIPADVTRTASDATLVNGNHDSLFYLRQANSSLAGLMTAAGYTKLNDMPSAQEVNAGLAYDVSVLHPTSGVNGGSTYASLSAALAVIPQDKRKGGMSVKFVLSSDNKYVQFRYMLPYANTTEGNAAFIDESNWQGVDDFLNKESHNVVTSGSVYDSLFGDGLTNNQAINEEVGYQLYTDGSTTPSGNPSIVRTYNVTGATKAVITGRQAGSSTVNGALAVAYDDNNNVLYAWAGNPATNYEDYKINLPPTTVYLKVCCSSTVLQPRYTKCTTDNGIIGLDKKFDGYLFENTPLGNLQAINEEDNYILNTDGTVEQLSNAITCTYNISGKSKVYITGRQGKTTGKALAVAYDNTLSNVLYSWAIKASTNFNEYEITLPLGAVYLKVCCSSKEFQPKQTSCRINFEGGVAQCLNDLLDETEEIRQEIESNIKILLLETKDDCKLMPDGTTDVSTSNGQIKEYRINDIVNVSITGRQGGTTTSALAAAYDINKNVLNVWTGEGSTNYIDYDITLPSGTAYLIVSSSNMDYLPEGISCKEAGAVPVDSIPSYWLSYMNSKIASINSKAYSIGVSGDNFIFITDVHLDRNFGNSPSLIKYIRNNTPVVNVVFGGDIYTPETADAISYLQNFKDSLVDVHNLYGIRGNHDVSAYLTKGHFYSIMDRPLENNVDTLDKEVYFYKDNKSQKIRYIFCDSSDTLSNIPTAQANWITQRITELESGWSVILFSHSYWRATGIGATPVVSASGSSLKTIIDNAVDNANATVVALITGHTHADRSVQSEKGYWIISTTCDANGVSASTFDPVTPTRTAGTTTEQVFDVFNIDTANKKIYITRIGGNGTDREFTYL